MRNSLAWLSLLTWPLLSGCEHLKIVDGTTCTPAGFLSSGGLCSHLIANTTATLSFNEMIDFLEAQPARTCVQKGHYEGKTWVVDVPSVCADDQSVGVKVALSARGGAIAMSSSDWNNLKTEAEVGCRMLGNKCSYELKTMAAKK